MISRMDVPVGTILDYAGSAVPTGYLECDGSAISRSTYSKLFEVLGTTWGAGDGSTTFNLPNLGWRVTVGAGNNGANTTDYWGAFPASTNGTQTIGEMGGQAKHTLATGELPSHAHTVPEHGHTYTRPTVSSSGAVTNGISGGSHAHTSKGWISTSSDMGNSGTWRMLIGNGSSTSYSVNSSTHTHNLPNHSHTLTGGGVANKAAFNTNNTGSGTAMAIMQPYAVVRKIIRVA